MSFSTCHFQKMSWTTPQPLKSSIEGFNDGSIDNPAPSLQDNCHESVSSPVFVNPVILDVLFSGLDVPTLKLIRLVCSLWGTVGGSHLGRKTFVQVVKHVPRTRSQKNHSLLAASVNKKILQNLEMDLGCYHRHYPRWNRYKWTIVPPNEVMLRFCSPILSHVAPTLVQLSLFNVPQQYLINPFLDIFSTIKFRNLKKITMHNIHPYPCPEPIRPTRLERAAVLSKNRIDSFSCLELTSLSELHLAWVACDCEIYTSLHEMETKKVHPILQQIIYSAPNLGLLNISRNNFYPDLSRSGKLVEFCYKGQYELRGGIALRSITFDVGEVARMIGQVKETLVKLSLGSKLIDTTRDAKVGPFYLPILPKLTYLDVDLRFFKLTNFTSGTLPGLKRLDLEARIDWENGYKLLDLNVPHPGIQELCCNFVTDQALHSQIVTLFPNTKHVKLVSNFPVRGRCLPTEFRGEFFDPLHSWNLSYLEISVIVSWVIHQLAEILKTVGQLTGTKTLKLFGGNEPYDEDAEAQCLDGIKSSLHLFSAKDSIIIGRTWPNRLLTRTVDEIIGVSKERNINILFI